jgi:predicted lipid-binding transport protein (Tim44 family)
MTEHIIFQSVARRIEAGTYRPHLTIPAVTTTTTTRPMREYAYEILASGFLGGLIGFLLGGGLS